MEATENRLSRSVFVLIALGMLLQLAGCGVLGGNQLLHDELNAAKSVTVTVSEPKRIVVHVIERADFSEAELQQAEAIFNQGLRHSAVQRIGEYVASKLKERGYDVNLEAPDSAAGKDPGTDATIAISDLAIVMYAEPNLFFGRQYRIVMVGRLSIHTGSQEFIHKEPQYYANFRDDSQGIVGIKDITNGTELTKQFNLTMNGWVRRYMEGSLKNKNRVTAAK